MKHFAKFLFATLALAVGLSSCNPPAEPADNRPLELKVDKSEIFANGEDTATFTVLQEGIDVTDKCIVSVVGAVATPLPSNAFSSTEKGRFVFLAYLATDAAKADRTESNHVIVTVADDPEPKAEFDATKRLYKNVSFFVSTVTWGDPCHYLYTYMNDVVNQNSNKLVRVNLYVTDTDGGVETPDMKVSSTLADTFLAQLGEAEQLNATRGYPGVFADLDARVGSYATNPENGEIQYYVPQRQELVEALDKYFRYPAKTGIRIESSIDEEANRIDMTISVGAKDAGSYRIGALLIEDNIECFQKGGGDAYNHVNVLRDAAVEDIFGENLATMESGDVVSKEYGFEVKPEYNTAQLSVVVYTLYENESGHIVIANIAKSPVGELTDFKYIE
jgi:cytochrome c1